LVISRMKQNFDFVKWKNQFFDCGSARANFIVDKRSRKFTRPTDTILEYMHVNIVVKNDVSAVIYSTTNSNIVIYYYA
jgi:hypothetical protein